MQTALDCGEPRNRQDPAREASPALVHEPKRISMPVDRVAADRPASSFPIYKSLLDVLAFWVRAESALAIMSTSTNRLVLGNTRSLDPRFSAVR